jgi:putative oxidoreductase
MAMALSRRLARPLLASIFVVGGWDAFWNPEGKVKKAVAVTDPLAKKAGVENLDAAMLVRVNGAVQIAGGILLATGKFRRPAALALIASIVPTTYAGHRFWEELDPATRAQQKMHFLKNVGLLGGLILAAFDTEGEPSLAWRAKRQARQLESTVAVGRASGRRKARKAQRALTPALAQASKSGKQTIRRGRAAGRQAGHSLGSAGHSLGSAGHSLGTAGHGLAEKVTPDPEALSHAHEVVADVVKGSTGTATHAVQQAASFVSDAARQLEPLTRSGSHPRVDAIVPYIASGAERTTEVLSKLREHLPTD